MHRRVLPLSARVAACERTERDYENVTVMRPARPGRLPASYMYVRVRLCSVYTVTYMHDMCMYAAYV
jgi:hypothetical protein